MTPSATVTLENNTTVGAQPPNASSLSLGSQSLPTSRPKSPRKVHTDPQSDVKTQMFKRIVVCCDGTWQDGISASKSKYTNVLRLARAVTQEDSRLEPPVAQVVFYQPGIGSDENFYSRYVQGATGESLGDKVEQAYAFIAQNYSPGDEIFLFGFSRGAYTARMVAQFVGEIGVLDRKDMDSFAQIFIDYQLLGVTKEANKRETIEAKLAPWRSPEARGKKRVITDGNKFTLKFLGVWDTVGALGLPGPFREEQKVFGFNDSLLGDHIERACQALALNETRQDFNCNKLQQTEAGRAKKQYLKQVWFSGCHSDIGGGYDRHDLSDLTLIWMANEVDKFLSLDLEYLQSLVQPVAPWGKQRPHDPIKGIFLLAIKVGRTLPYSPNDLTTHEFIHESVLQQPNKRPDVEALVEKYPGCVCRLGHLEGAVKKNWPYDEGKEEAQQYDHDVKNWLGKLVNVTKHHDVAVITESTSNTTEVKVDQLRSEETTTHVRSERVVLEVFGS